LSQSFGTYNPTDEWLKEHLSGWIEKHEDGKVLATLRTHYRVVNTPEDKQILAHEYYIKTTEADFVKKAAEAKFYKAIYKDLFRTHLSLLTQSMTYSGVLMEVTLLFPNYRSELMFIAQVTRVDSDNELGRDIYHAHLKIIAVNQKSLIEMMHDIADKKV
jgi:hypothetical protein